MGLHFLGRKRKSKLPEEYITFLRSIFNSSVAQECIHLVYITGIQPIKKYGIESAFNNPKSLTDYNGFTENEVKGLCKNM